MRGMISEWVYFNMEWPEHRGEGDWPITGGFVRDPRYILPRDGSQGSRPSNQYKATL